MSARIGYGAILALLGLLAVGGTVRAQEGLPVTPDPSECTVAPMPLDELVALVGTPAAGPVADVATPAAFALPDGEAADPAAVEGITATVRTVLACFNAGNYLAYFALGSDAFVTTEFAEDGLGEEVIGFLAATPQATDPADWSTLVGVREATVLPDGRVGALVDTIFPDEEPGVQTDYLTFVEEDGTWLLDGIVEDLEDQFPPASATPTAA